jgi:exodeoxyribonuclease V alpha subunit
VTDALDRLRRAGVLAPLDVHLARSLHGLVRDEPESVALAIALASRAVRHGHVCADLRRLLATPLSDEDGRPIDDVALPSQHAWALDLGASSLVSAGDRPTPLVFDLHARLYLTRYFRYEQRLAEHLRTRVSARPAAPDIPTLRDGLARMFSPRGTTADPSARQRLAALVAVLRNLAVISGGPGTGKTTTVVRILALLVEQALAAGRPPPRIRLFAPTGKAAARLVESIAAQIDDLPCAAEVRAAIPREAATIHRGLGYRPGSPTRFAHDAEHPLPADVVLVDEASMVDLALMAKLFDAAPATARVLLLGDMNQLASVEAGAILGDICNRGEARASSREFAAEVHDAAGEALAPPMEIAAGSVPPIADCTVELVHSFRFSASGGIGAAARAINAGDAAGLADALGDPISAAEAAGTERDIALVAMTDDTDAGPLLAPVVAAALGPYVRAADPQARLDALGTFRLLCAHRHGAFGVERLGHAVERILARRAGLRPDETFYDGRPIMVTTNDYQLDLYNGDVGVVHEGADGRRRAWFPSPTGLRALSPARLPAHETVFAMTVHKSQGSEFDRVVLLVPPAVSPILTRELLYTAITRARTQVLVFGDPRVLPRAIARRIDRASGLREALWDHG